jgi:hypothetical protein
MPISRVRCVTRNDTNAVNPDRRQDQAEDREAADEQHVEPRPRQRARHDVVHRANPLHQQLRIVGRYAVAQCSRDRRRRQRRPHDQRRQEDVGVLGVRNEHSRRRGLLDRRSSNVRDDADDRP